jgi:DNA repair protein SbcD/Mre11
MRILHTADWHLNDRLGRIDRTDDLRLAVERIAVLCETERIDVLVIAGDLFSDLARSDSLRESVDHLQMTFRTFLDREGTILAVTGNHDNETFSQTIRHAMSLAAGDVTHPGALLKPGRFFLATKPTHLILNGVTFVLMPWPTVSQYSDSIDPSALASERSAQLSKAFRQALTTFVVAPKKPSVLIAHIQATTVSEFDRGFRIDERENIAYDILNESQRFSYLALGHVHKPQQLGRYEHVRYSGSLERLDLGEQRDDKGCVIFELNDQGLIGSPVWIPLPATKIVQHIIHDAETQIPILKDKSPTSEKDLVKLIIGYKPVWQNRETILKDLTALFPRWYERIWEEIQPTQRPNESPEIIPTVSFTEQVRNYVAQQWTDFTEPEQKAFAIKLETLLQSEGS